MCVCGVCVCVVVVVLVVVELISMTPTQEFLYESVFHTLLINIKRLDHELFENISDLIYWHGLFDISV